MKHIVARAGLLLLALGACVAIGTLMLAGPAAGGGSERGRGVSGSAGRVAGVGGASSFPLLLCGLLISLTMASFSASIAL